MVGHEAEHPDQAGGRRVLAGEQEVHDRVRHGSVGAVARRRDARGRRLVHLGQAVVGPVIYQAPRLAARLRWVDLKLKPALNPFSGPATCRQLPI